jgi:hypothetical protein
LRSRGAGAPHELGSSPPHDPLSAAVRRLAAAERRAAAGRTDEWAGALPEHHDAVGADAGFVAAAPVEGLAGLARLAAAVEDPGAVPPPLSPGAGEPRRRRAGALGAPDGPGAPRADTGPAGFAWRLEQVLLSEARRHGITVEER